jgi:hypothetical protein
VRFLDLKVGPAQYGAHGESFLDRGRTPALFLLLFFLMFFFGSSSLLLAKAKLT